MFLAEIYTDFLQIYCMLSFLKGRIGLKPGFIPLIMDDSLWCRVVAQANGCLQWNFLIIQNKRRKKLPSYHVPYLNVDAPNRRCRSTRGGITVR